MLTASAAPRLALRPVADVLDPVPARRDCQCGRPECLSYQDAVDTAHMVVCVYVSADDDAADALRARYSIPGQRPEGAAARWYERWAGELADALRRRLHRRAQSVAAGVVSTASAV